MAKLPFTVITPWYYVHADRKNTFYENLLLALVAANCFLFSGLWFLA